jgi:RND family efflux transporter MFP subunit
MSSDKATLEGLRIDRTQAPARSVPPWLVILVLGLLALGGGAYWIMIQPNAAVVQTAIVKSPASSPSVSQSPLLNASGYVTARRAATVSSKVTGKVVEVLVEEGMKVEANQILAYLDDSNVKESLKLAEAQLESAKRAMEETRPNLTFAKQEEERFADLVAKKATSESEFHKAQAQTRVLEATLARQQAEIVVAERTVSTWKQQVDDNVIRAPFAGIVTSKNAQPGEMISPMSAGGSFTRTGICTLVDMTSLEIEVDVSESYINRVHSGQSVLATLDAYQDWKIPAKVIAIIPTADRQKATVKVRVGFNELDPRVLPDMAAKVAFQRAATPAGKPSASSTVLTVPKSAVHRVDGRDIVWVVRDGRVERRAVTISDTAGDEATVAAGLSAGESVVIQSSESLADGARVTQR